MAVTWKFRCASFGVVSSLMAAVLATYCVSPETDLSLRVITGGLTILVGIISLISFHISSLPCSESHTLRTLLLSYVWHQREIITTPFLMAKLKDIWTNPRATQEELLRKLTTRDAKTEHGRHYRLGEIHSLKDLTKKHPLTTYDNYKEYIQRLADGEEGVIVGEKPVRFGVTSGTTGVGKKIPYGGHWYAGDAMCRKVNRLAVYLGSSRPSPVQKRCFLYTHPRPVFTKTGLIIAPYALFMERDTLPFAEHSSPRPAFNICDEPVATYVHMLFAIADRNLGHLSSMFAPQMYRALRAVESNWESMLLDLSTGQINTKVPLAPDLRQSIQHFMKPDMDRISELRKEFEKGFEGIVKRIWPHLVSLEAIDISGYKNKIQDTYAKGLIVGSTKFGGTEAGMVGINMWMKEEHARYVLLPFNCIYEFIPEEQSLEEQPKSLLIDEVQAGEKYELVLTTQSGLYRYRYGDVIEVEGLHENCPVIRMKYRIGDLLNVATEKTNSFVVTAAVEQTVEGWSGLQLTDWTCAESPLYDPGTTDLYYVLFVELESGDGDLNITAEQRLQFDENLQKGHDLYKNYRISRTITASRVHVVRPGTFKELREYTVSRTTASVNQFKTPRKLRTKEHIEWMMQRVMEAK